MLVDLDMLVPYVGAICGDVRSACRVIIADYHVHVGESTVMYVQALIGKPYYMQRPVLHNITTYYY